MYVKRIKVIFMLATILYLPVASFAANGQGVTAKVLQTLRASNGFLFLQVQEKSGKNTWIAIPDMKINVKDVIKYPETPPQLNLTVKAVNKTFSEVSFVPGIMVISSSEPNIKAELAKIGRNDQTCEKSMKLVKKNFGKPDEFIQLSSNTMTTIYRTKRLHFTYEIVGKTCVTTNSEF